MASFRAVLFNPDGTNVSDFQGPSIQNVWDQVRAGKSKYPTYPIVFVCMNFKILDVPEGLEFLRHRTLRKVQKYFRVQYEEKSEMIHDVINSGGNLGSCYENTLVQVRAPKSSKKPSRREKALLVGINKVRLELQKIKNPPKEVIVSLTTLDVAETQFHSYPTNK